MSDRRPHKSDLSDEPWALIEPVIASWTAQHSSVSGHQGAYEMVIAVVVPAKVTAKTVRVWSCADGGRTWKAATVRHTGSTWHATVNNPPSGAVALRFEVTDSAGDHWVETVYRAYAIG